jgi:hypothetical protein
LVEGEEEGMGRRRVDGGEEEWMKTRDSLWRRGRMDENKEECMDEGEGEWMKTRKSG